MPVTTDPTARVTIKEFNLQSTTKKPFTAPIIMEMAIAAIRAIHNCSLFGPAIASSVVLAAPIVAGAERSIPRDMITNV
ncbi:hypothetical protein D3C80_1403200 [compost metagenome]